MKVTNEHLELIIKSDMAFNVLLHVYNEDGSVYMKTVENICKDLLEARAAIAKMEAER